MPPATWLNLAFPGAGLLLRGRLGLGLSLLLPAVVLLSALALAQVVATSTMLGSWRLGILGGYILLGGLATALHAVLLRERPVDPEAVRQLVREVAAAYLGQRPAEAVAAAQRLVKLAPRQAGSWRLLAQVSDSAGDATTAGRARRRADQLDAEALT